MSTEKQLSNLTSDVLREMIISSYIEEASINMIKDFQSRMYIVKIRKKDRDLCEKLMNHWRKGGFSPDNSVEGADILIRLTW